MAYFHLSKLNLGKANGNRRDKVTMRTTCNQYAKFKIIKILLLQRKPKLDRTKPLTGPWVGHSCLKHIIKTKILLR